MHLADQWDAGMCLSRWNARTRAVGGHLVHDDAPRNKVCIYGGGLYREQAPLSDFTWEVWTCNLLAPRDIEGGLRADRWFDIHQREAQTADDLRWIASCPFPCYLPPDLMGASPNAVAYPLGEIEERFGGYWACTFAYQIALVMHEGAADTIGLYGVELAFGTERERTVEWANVAYWMGRAEQRGIEFDLPGGSTLGAHVARYGFEYAEEIRGVNDYLNLLRARKAGE